MWLREEVRAVSNKTDVIRARIDPAIKAEAVEVLDKIGLTLSDAFRLMVTRVAREHRLPFDPLVPNAATVAAMAEARNGGLRQVATVDDLMAELNADD